MTARPLHQQYIIYKGSGGGENPDPATYCPANGYELPPDPAVFCPANGYVDPEGLVDPDDLTQYDPTLGSWELILRFKTNSPNSTTFDPTIGSGSLDADFAWKINGNIYNTRTLSVTLDGSETDVFLYAKKGSLPILNLDFRSDHIIGRLDFSHTMFRVCANFTLSSNAGLTGVILPPDYDAVCSYFAVNNCNITGVLDLSLITKFSTSTQLRLYANPNLTGVNFGNITQGNLAVLSAYGCNLLNTLDISGLAYYTTNAQVLLYSNPNLTNIKFPPTIVSGAIFYLHIYSCNLSGTLNLSGIDKWNAGATQLFLYGNSNLSNIIFPASHTGVIADIRLYSTGLSGTLNLSTVTFGSGTLQVRIYSTNISEILFPASTPGTYSYWQFNLNPVLQYLSPLPFPNMTNRNNLTVRVDGNGWDAVKVNQFLSEIDSISSSGYTGRNLYIGGTNDAPDNSSGGFDGLASKASLQAKGFIVNTN